MKNKNKPEFLKAANTLYHAGHQASPFMTLESGPDGCKLVMKFKSLEDGQSVHSALVWFYASDKPSPRQDGAFPAHDSDGKYARFSGNVICRAWCTANNMLYPEQHPLNAKDVLSMARLFGIRTIPSRTFICMRKVIKGMKRSLKHGK